jgi:hypothetical protein
LYKRPYVLNEQVNSNIFLDGPISVKPYACLDEVRILITPTNHLKVKAAIYDSSIEAPSNDKPTRRAPPLAGHQNGTKRQALIMSLHKLAGLPGAMSTGKLVRCSVQPAGATVSQIVTRFCRSAIFNAL